jgi:hypothetical protein
MSQLKRKSPSNSESGSSKKSRTDQSPHGASEAPPLPSAQNHLGDDAGRTDVPWVLPSRSSKDHERDESEAVTQYAQSLFNRSWDTIEPQQLPFRFPLVRTPIYKAKGRDITVNDLHQPCATFRNLFHSIKCDSGGSGWNAPGRGITYTRDAFNGAFIRSHDRDAVVASTSTADPVLVLDQDYRLEV